MEGLDLFRVWHSPGFYYEEVGVGGVGGGRDSEKFFPKSVFVVYKCITCVE